MSSILSNQIQVERLDLHHPNPSDSSSVRRTEVDETLAIKVIILIIKVIILIIKIIIVIIKIIIVIIKIHHFYH